MGNGRMGGQVRQAGRPPVQRLGRAASRGGGWVGGWAVGRSIMGVVAAFDHWVAFGLMSAIGGHMVFEGFKEGEERSDRDRSKGWSLVALSVATSLDALGVGLTFGVTETDGILVPALVIGFVSSAMSLLGIYLSRRLKTRFGRQMEIVGGVILVAIGIRFLFTV